VQIAAEHLRDSLSSNWRIETSDQDVPPLSLTGIPLEQTILNLGLLVADSLAAPGILRIAAGVPGSGARFDVDHPCAGVILVSAAPSNGPAGHDNDALRETGVEPGAILSVVRSLVEEAGGTLHSLTDASGFPIYRVALPAGQPPAKHRESVTNAELAGYVRQWSVLLACEAGLRDWFKSAMTAVGMRITAVTDIASALAQIDENRAFDGIVLDEHLLAPEPAGVLRAIVRLQPASAIVLLSHRPPALLSELADNAVTVQPNRDINALMLGLIEGKSLAARRPRPASRTA
jgi:hypothetical protein